MKDVPKPNPKRLKKRLKKSESSEHAAIWCRFYDKCLGIAAKENWKGMSCAQCPWQNDQQRKEKIHEYSISWKTNWTGFATGCRRVSVDDTYSVWNG